MPAAIKVCNPPGELMVEATPLPAQDVRSYTELEQIQTQLAEIQIYNDLRAKDKALVTFIKANCQ